MFAARWPALGIAVLGGVAAALGQAPFDLWWLALAGFVALCGLISVAAAPGRAALLAWVAGTAHFATALHWIVEPFFVDAERHGWMAPFALVLMAGGLALFWAVAGWIAARLVPNGESALRAIAFAAALTLSEAARGVLFTGFPWAQPGHILIDTPLLPLSALVGPLGLTALVLFTATALVVLVHRGRSRLAVAVFGAVAVGVGLLPAPSAPRPAADAPVVRLIQPNAPQHLKWRRDMIEVFFQRGLDLTATAPEGRAPDLVVWPETSLPQLLDRSDASRARIAQAAGAAPVVIGAQRFRDDRPVNSLALLGPDGRVQGVYDKHRLVPFGEYLPFGDRLADWGLRGLAEVLPGGYTPGEGPTTLDLGALGTAFPMICYEAIFPTDIRRVDTRPDWMLHITNDAWFGTFSGPYQHLALARLRAAEQGLPLLRAANTGISGVIDARGRVVAALPLGEAGALDVALPPALPPTLYARTGDVPILIVVLFAGLATIAAGRRRARH
nr:apolipoprotein N-acyltransferase [Roseibacterium elongatum]